MKSSKLRNAKVIKSYVCVFVCLSTKAVHMEIVSDLSTEGFLSAFDKFVSRRGLPASVTSDHGLNFVGARNKLSNVIKFLKLQTTQTEIHDYLAQQEVKWNFIPPRAPYQGGLWEAAVKSMKHHFYRVASHASLTFEEFDRLKSKIEAILNSRPLTAVSDDPNDLTALTAGHFLIFRPLIAKPDRDVTDQPLTRLQRWDRILQTALLEALEPRILAPIANSHEKLRQSRPALCRPDGAAPNRQCPQHALAPRSYRRYLPG
jgi:hypothetical protein